MFKHFNIYSHKNSKRKASSSQQLFVPMSKQGFDSKQIQSCTLDHQFISTPLTCTKLTLEKEAIIKQYKDQKQWNLSSKKVPIFAIKDIFQKVQKLDHVQLLYLHWNEDPKILMIPIQHPMPKLRLINLGGNNIESIQPLQRADLRNLLQLWLWFNRLVRVDSLRKCHFPSLQYLDLSDNYLQECPKLSQMHAPMIQRINIEKNGFSSLTHFVKCINRTPSPFLLLFMQNKMVKVFKQPIKKGRRLINQLTYQPKGGLKFN